MSNKVESIGRKVVQLEPSGDRILKSQLARLPAEMQAARETSLQILMLNLKKFFERADDSLFELADNACSNEEQNLFFDSMREVRVRRHGIETHFCAAVDAAFVELIQSGHVPQQDDFDILNADSLSLVQDDDLEALVAVDSAVAKANAAFGEAVQYLLLRLDSLVPVKVYQKNNPIGADVICNAFMTEVKKLDVNIKAKLVLFRLFEKVIITGLGELYRKVNEVLVAHNVMPTFAAPKARQKQVRRRSDQSAVIGANVNTRQSNSGGVDGELMHVAPEVAETLVSLFGDNVLSSSLAAGNSPNSQLVQLLNAAQKLPIEKGQIQKGQDIQDALSQLPGGQRRIDAGGEETQVMNLVGMLFDFILEDRNLPDLMKTLISRMQIPIIKVALADKTFFTKKGHVARKLLNEMSRAAMGWVGDEKAASKDPLYQKIDSIVRALVNNFDNDLSIFSELLADFTSFVDKERKRAAVLEKRTLDAEDGKAKAEVARKVIAIELELRTLDFYMPEPVAKLIHQAWSNVMFVTALKFGYESKDWLEALNTLDDLLWSVQTPANPEERQKLIAAIPKILQRIKAGLDTISYNPFDISSMFKGLEDVHLECIRGKSNYGVIKETSKKEEEAKTSLKSNTTMSRAQAVAQPEVPPEAADANLEDGIAEIDELMSAVDDVVAEEQPPQAEDPNGINAAHYMQVENFVQGAWFDLEIDGAKIRCRLAAFIKPTGKYIFVGRNGMKLAESTKDELAAMVFNKTIQPLDSSMLFDRALEQIVSGIRDKRS